MWINVDLVLKFQAVISKIFYYSFKNWCIRNRRFCISLFSKITIILQGLQSLSVISNLVLTDRKKAINIKIMVNPVKGRWEIWYGTTKIQKKITYGSQFICQSQNLHLIWKIWLSGYWDVDCVENTFDHQKWWLFCVFCGVQPAQWDRRINFVQKRQKVVFA